MARTLTVTRRQLLGALAGSALLAGRARADHRVTLDYGGRARGFGLVLTLSELSYDHFDDGSFDAWAVLEARAGGRSAQVMLSIHEALPRELTLLGRRLRVVARSDTALTVEG